MAIMSLKIKKNGLISIRAQGEFTIRELKNYSMMAFVNNSEPLVLWDISTGSVSKISCEEIKEAANQVSSFNPDLKGGKVAFVVKSESDFDILRMYETHIGLTNLPISYEIFYTLEEAKAWLELEGIPVIRELNSSF